MNIKDALKLKPVTVEVNGYEAVLKRPSMLDYVQAVEYSKKSPDTFMAFLVAKHLMDGPHMAFKDENEVMQCDADLVFKLADKIQDLYDEGSKSPMQ